MAETQTHSKESVDLMRAIYVREYTKNGPVTTPGEVFAVLLGMGYKRSDNMDVQTRASEFLGQVRERLNGDNRQVPSYDEVLSVITDLGYKRALAG